VQGVIKTGWLLQDAGDLDAAASWSRRAAAWDLLADPVRYRQARGAAYRRSRNYRSADIADAFLKAVW
jgi:predicted metal-dependent phosphoesterase TrpH